MGRQKIKKLDLEKDLKNSGFRLTGSRKTIFNVISSVKKALSAEEIFILARKKNPSIGIATVYRTLGLLEDSGIIAKTDTGDQKTKYILLDNQITAVKNIFNKKNEVFRETKKVVQKEAFIRDAIPAVLTTEYSANKNTDAGYTAFSDIDRIQTQLDRWLLEINKIKKEKEIKLEEMINDFTNIDSILKKYDNNESNLIQMLLDIQGDYNWLPKHALLYVGNRLQVPLTQIYSIASFYKFFNLEPKGKYQITVCAGTACHVRGSMNLLQRIVNILKIDPGDTTADYKFTLDTVNCLGCCALGPVMYFNDKYYSDPSTKELKKLFNTV